MKVAEFARGWLDEELLKLMVIKKGKRGGEVVKQAERFGLTIWTVGTKKLLNI